MLKRKNDLNFLNQWFLPHFHFPPLPKVVYFKQKNGGTKSAMTTRIELKPSLHCERTEKMIDFHSRTYKWIAVRRFLTHRRAWRREKHDNEAKVNNEKKVKKGRKYAREIFAVEIGWSDGSVCDLLMISAYPLLVFLVLRYSLIVS